MPARRRPAAKRQPKPTPVPPAVDPTIAYCVQQRRRLLLQLQEVIRRVGPSTPNREEVNAERAVRRQQLKDAIHTVEWRIIQRAVELVPPEYNDLPHNR